MAEAELESLLSPLAADAPCGADPEYDPAFVALNEAGAGKPERQYGDKLYKAEPPDWDAVHEQALQLAARTRDLRVAVWLARSGARSGGVTAAVLGLQLIQGLVERHWPHVHPLLDPADNHDPTARMSALAPLVDLSAGLADFRAAGLTGKRGALTLREIELALGHAEPLPGEAAPSKEGVAQAVNAAQAEQPALLAALRAGLDAAQGLAAVIEQQVEASQSPQFKPLIDLMGCAAEAARLATGEAPQASGASVGRAGVPALAGTIASRDDAIRALERVCEWIERSEPSNPAPLLIRRAQRLMSKNFIDIIRDLVPDGVSQIEKLAGISDS